MSGADDQPQPQFAHRTGALGAGNDLDSGTYTVAEAMLHCAAINALGFTFSAAEASPSEKVLCYFKSSAAGNQDPQWQTYLAEDAMSGAGNKPVVATQTGSRPALDERKGGAKGRDEMSGADDQPQPQFAHRTVFCSTGGVSESHRRRVAAEALSERSQKYRKRRGRAEPYFSIPAVPLFPPFFFSSAGVCNLPERC
jgi:hypothetical protein